MAKTDTTESKIIEAASNLFHESGVHWVSFQQIAEQVGISQSAIYRHFEDKDDLLRACIKRMAQLGREIIDQNIDETRSAEDQLMQYIEGNFIWLKKRPKDGALFLALYYFGFNNKSINELAKEVNSQSEQRLTIRLLAGQREGSWKTPNPVLTARGIHNLLVGELFKYINNPTELPWKARVENTCSLVRIQLGEKD
jgi:AcrR family transcriptional regulator